MIALRRAAHGFHLRCTRNPFYGFIRRLCILLWSIFRMTDDIQGKKQKRLSILAPLLNVKRIADCFEFDMHTTLKCYHNILFSVYTVGKLDSRALFNVNLYSSLGNSIVIKGHESSFTAGLLNEVRESFFYPSTSE